MAARKKRANGRTGVQLTNFIKMLQRDIGFADDLVRNHQLRGGFRLVQSLYRRNRLLEIFLRMPGQEKRTKAWQLNEHLHSLSG
jgi:hypothetical protein